MSNKPARIAVAALAIAGLVGIAAPADAAAKRYSSCAQLNKVYKHGVGRKGAHDKVRGTTKKVTNFTVNTAVYNANRSRLDRDHDGIACEKL